MPAPACPDDGRQAYDYQIKPAQHQRLACVAPFVSFSDVVVPVAFVEDDMASERDASGDRIREMKPDSAVLPPLSSLVVQGENLPEDVLGELPKIKENGRQGFHGLFHTLPAFHNNPAIIGH